MRRRKFVSLSLAASACALPLFRAHANTETVQLIVGFSPGGTIDAIARALAEGMRSKGLNCIVENRAGASGRMALDALTAARPDGSTLLIAPSTQVTLLPLTNGKVRKLEQIQALGTAAECHFGLAVKASAEFADLQAFLQAARKDPNLGFYAVPGNGTVMDFLGRVLAKKAQLKFNSVPYKGGIAALNDVVAGVVPWAITAVPNLLPMQQSGQIRLLGVSASQALSTLPGVPTFASQGFPELTASEQVCMFGMQHIPAQRQQALTEALRYAVEHSSARSIMERQNYIPRFVDAPAARAQIEKDKVRWAAAVKSTGFTVN